MSAYFVSSRMVPKGTLSPIAHEIFGAYEQGVMYDPSDMSTLFQDSAGTTPVTALEQPVGLMLDKSGRGNHASQATTTKRPVLSARYNLFTKTEEITPVFSSGPGWTHGAFGNWTVPINLGAQLAPDGTNTATGLKTSGANGVSSSVQRVNVTPGESLVFRIGVRKVEGEDQSGLGGLSLIFQTGNSGAVVDPYASSVMIGGSVTDTWQQFEYSYMTPATGVNQVEVGLWFASPNTAAVAVWGASLTRATDAHLPYQWVNTATDYDADPAKFPAYLRFDGVDDALQTGNIDFTSTDKMTVWTGSLNTGATGYHLLYEFGRPASVDVGTFSHFAALDAAGRVAILSKAGASEGQGRFIPVVPPVLDITSYALDASKSVPTEAMPVLRKNGQSVGISYTGTFSTASGWGNHPLYIGARAGTSLYFNGRLYSLIVRGAQSSLSQIEATELYIKQKMRMP